jgi:hypothetical protein
LEHKFVSTWVIRVASHIIWTARALTRGRQSRKTNGERERRARRGARETEQEQEWGSETKLDGKSKIESKIKRK